MIQTLPSAVDQALSKQAISSSVVNTWNSLYLGSVGAFLPAAMVTVSEDVVLPVGGVILEPIPIARVLWVKALFIFERATTTTE